jgi:hypothetical protein
MVAYLHAHGWRSTPYPRPELRVFEGPLTDSGEPAVQVLPASEKAIDYQQRLLELITALGVIEDRPAFEVLDAILEQREASAAPRNGPPRSNEVAHKKKKKR